VQKVTKIGKLSSAFRPYTSKIIKAGALIGDTKTLLSHWDTSESVAENIDRIQRENVFGKASRSRVEDILAIFRQRYLAEECVTKALVSLVRGKFPAAALERVFYFHSARADQLLHDAVTQILVPMHERGLVDINVQEFQRSIAKWVAEGKTTGHWSEPTITRIAQGLLSAMRDFGVLQGAVNKKIAPSFRAQRAALRQSFPQLCIMDPTSGLPVRSAIDTVERFQGGERTLILVSATESDRAYLLASCQFLLDPRRLTVALSRAKRKMILVASRSIFSLFSTDEETFANSLLWKNLLLRTCSSQLWEGERKGKKVAVWGGKR